MTTFETEIGIVREVKGEEEPRLEVVYPQEYVQLDREIYVSPKSHIDPLLEEITKDCTSDF
jgi:hypothetical protein